MVKLKTTGLLLVIAITGMIRIKAQDIHFSQFNETPLLVNPASAGTGYDLRAILNYRDQWSSVTTPYRTFAASFEMKASKDKSRKGNMGLGFYAFNDKAGTSKMTNTQLALALSGILSLNTKNTISAGISGGYNMRSCTTSDLKWESQYGGQGYDPAINPNETFTGQSFGYADINAGLQWNFGQGERYITANDEFKMNLGFAISHINRPRQKFYALSSKLYSKMTVNGGFVLGISNTNLLVAPSFVCHFQGPEQEIFAGSMFKYKIGEDSKYTGFKKGACVSVGGYYRVQDAFVVVTQLEFGQYSIGLSYDLNTSKLNEASNGRGGFEISLRFVNPNPHLFKSSSRL